jgi:hypothetical protein
VVYFDYILVYPLSCRKINAVSVLVVEIFTRLEKSILNRFGRCYLRASHTHRDECAVSKKNAVVVWAATLLNLPTHRFSYNCAFWCLFKIIGVSSKLFWCLFKIILVCVHHCVSESGTLSRLLCATFTHTIMNTHQ